MTKDAINPSHYKAGWSDGAEVISISENLTSNGGQALQYIARSTRIDPKLNKGQTVDELVEDLTKAIWFAQREIKRIKAISSAEAKAKAVEASVKAAADVAVGRGYTYESLMKAMNRPRPVFSGLY